MSFLKYVVSILSVASFTSLVACAADEDPGVAETESMQTRRDVCAAYDPIDCSRDPLCSYNPPPYGRGCTQVRQCSQLDGYACRRSKHCVWTVAWDVGCYEVDQGQGTPPIVAAPSLSGRYYYGKNGYEGYLCFKSATEVIRARGGIGGLVPVSNDYQLSGQTLQLTLSDGHSYSMTFDSSFRTLTDGYDTYVDTGHGCPY
jgi:hypothetical protein